MRLPSKRLRYGSAVVGLLLTATLHWPINGTALTLEEGQCFFSPGHFTLHWLHSVEHEVWQEDYQREDSGFLLTTTRFRTFGAGVPHDGDLQLDEQGYINRSVNLHLPEISRTVSRLTETTLLVGEYSWPLFKWTGDYTNLQLRPARQVLWRHLFIKDYCHEQLRNNASR